MIKFFAYDNEKNRVIVNEPEILLIKEFADLWTNERNACKEDPSGDQKLRGFKELIYIYIAIDWGAPGSKDTPANRHKAAMEASGLTEEEFNDPIFKAACNKYKQLQESSSVVGQMVATYTNKIHEMQEFVKSINYDERDNNGNPIFKIKDTLLEMQSLSKALDALKELENKYKEEQSEATGLRGDATPGMFD